MAISKYHTNRKYREQTYERQKQIRYRKLKEDPEFYERAKEIRSKSFQKHKKKEARSRLRRKRFKNFKDRKGFVFFGDLAQPLLAVSKKDYVNLRKTVKDQTALKHVLRVRELLVFMEAVDRFGIWDTEKGMYGFTKESLKKAKQYILNNWPMGVYCGN